MTAKDLNEAFVSLEDVPLKDEWIERYYQGRKDSPIKKIKNALYLSKKPQKILFAGHRGCGKSTELNILTKELEKDFFVINYSVFHSLDINNFSHIDLLLATKANICKKALEKKLIDGKKMPGLLNWAEEIINVGTGIAKGDWFTSFDALIRILRNEPLSRQKIREEVELRISDLIESINQIINEIKENTNDKEILVIVEDIDKTSMEQARKLFCNYSSILTQPFCNIIYTIPIPLLYSLEFGQIRVNFDMDFCLPNIKISDISGNPYPEGEKLLKGLVLKRISADLIEEEALIELIRASGGVIRELIKSLQMACLETIGEEKVKIDKEAIKKVLNTRKIDFQRYLTDQDYDALRKAHRKEGIGRDDNMLELLHSLSLLEYLNGGRWYAIHPVVLPLVDARGE